MSSLTTKQAAKTRPQLGPYLLQSTHNRSTPVSGTHDRIVLYPTAIPKAASSERFGRGNQAVGQHVKDRVYVDMGLEHRS